MTTPELMAFLKAHPDNETECRLYLGHGLGATHYWYWDSRRHSFMHTRDWPFYAISEQHVLEDYGSCRWKVE